MLHKVCLPVTGIPEVTKEGTDALGPLCMKALIEQKKQTRKMYKYSKNKNFYIA